MRQGFYEVLVCPTNNPDKPFEETIIDGKTYVHAEPGEYKINVRVAPEFQHLVHGKLLCAKMEIDGEAADCYTAWTATDKMTCLQGSLDSFYKPNKTIFFAFKQPATVQAEENSGGEEEERQKLGTIKVTIHECELRSATGVTFTCAAGELKESRTVVEGKKFWKQPSLLTGGGRIAERAPITISSYYHALREIFAIELFYHTAGTIRILKNIADQGEHPAESSSSSSSSAAAVVGKKRGRVDNEVIDLTLE